MTQMCQYRPNSATAPRFAVLSEVIGHARPGDILCVTRLDRLGPLLKELLEIVEGLKEWGIHLANLEEEVETSSASGELVFHVFGAIARFERRLVAERTRDDIAAARKRGKKPGRPPLPRGKGVLGGKAHQGRNDARPGRKAAEHWQNHRPAHVHLLRCVTGFPCRSGTMAR
ncbi:MAG: recombinase family protein [Boseongicola sp.]|nr:recombinase family protein [Boseongicola sp.]